MTILQLLNRKLEKRLGARDDAEEIKRHPFFTDINWEEVYQRKLVLPKPFI